ncbi:unnamed protein product [Phytomonas sp. EM1]|nr:unnamed protein product [Phytomonas sp. EM1]|eukprot:CCW62837.1 unnamed protein product [Phytomonas sp. isolate EM1]
MLGLEGLAVLHVAVSLVAVGLNRAINTCPPLQISYPYSFHFDRLHIVIRFGGVLSFLFGCFICVLASLHHAMHSDELNPIRLAVVSTTHLGLTFFVRDDILLADRVFGCSSGLFESCREERWLELFINPPSNSNSIDPANVSLTTGGAGSSSKHSQSGNGAVDTKSSPLAIPEHTKVLPRSRFSEMLGLFLMPFAGLLTSFLIYCFNYQHIDLVCAGLLIPFYIVIGLRQCRSMAWVLLNNSVRDASTTAHIDSILNNLNHIDGVVNVHSHVCFVVSPVDILAIVRLCVKCDADACVVSTTARKSLMQVSKYAYVESFSADITEVELPSFAFNGKTISHHTHHHGCGHDDNGGAHGHHAH